MVAEDLSCYVHPWLTKAASEVLTAAFFWLCRNLFWSTAWRTAWRAAKLSLHDIFALVPWHSPCATQGSAATAAVPDVPTCSWCSYLFSQTTQKLCCFAAKAEKEKEPVFPPSSLQSTLSPPHCLKERRGRWGCSTASSPYTDRHLPHTSLLSWSWIHQWNGFFSSSLVTIIFYACFNSPHLLIKTSLMLLNDCFPPLIAISCQPACFLTRSSPSTCIWLDDLLKGKA